MNFIIFTEGIHLRNNYNGIEILLEATMSLTIRYFQVIKQGPDFPRKHELKLKLDTSWD